ncbi:MAG: type I restriction endonuclease subunit S [Epulopiscium sp. Nuni2H_MBin003]|nr:MAG: type I restriction endonuclease subunit S [Epulopiscium sp. Nuni2H_MBin003]
MPLTKYKLGELIERVECRNTNLKYGIDDVRGISNSKEIQPTKADVSNRSFKRFQIVSPEEFVFNRRTTRMGEKIGLGYNSFDTPFIVIEDYVVFKVTSEHLLSSYLNIFFRRSEFDRYVRWDSWGSATEFFNWEEMCDVEIELPPLEIQQKYVDIYNAMLQNQKTYEMGAEDLKLVCDGYIENLKKYVKLQSLKDYITRVDIRNGKDGTKNVMGISVYKEFREPTSKVNKDTLSNYKVVKPKQIAFVQTTHNEKVFAYALNNTNNDIVVSSVNEVFATDNSKVLPEFLAMFFSRTEFDRYARYNSWGSARETFTFKELIEVKIPIPDITVQQSIVNIYNAYIMRKDVAEKLKQQLKDVCPVLIKGAIEEARE